MAEQLKDFDMDNSMMKLGKLAPKKDERNLCLSKYLTDALPSFPQSCSYSPYIKDWGMMLNDTLSCCTCSAAGHQIQNWTNMNGNLFTPPDEDIRKAYEAVSGYDPSTGENDNGANMLDVMKYLKNTGISGRKIGAFLSVDVKNKTEIKTAIWLFGSVNIGIQLPLTARGQSMWDVVDWSFQGDSAPGSWGGHDVIVPSYGNGWRYCITWGRPLKMTAAFWDVYVDEAFVIIDPEWFTNGTAPNGFDINTLKADMALL
jgi:hypothetical protein